MSKREPESGEPKVFLQTLEEVMHNAFMPYAEYVILERALPRVEDGLKPVQRRILYTMRELSLLPDKPHRKSARIVGDCLGKYHPHGDTSVYDAMVRMAQPFNMQMPLVDGHGNFGSVDGDSPAAMRYTEARLTPLAMEMLRDIDKDTVPFRLNFDDTLEEPDMLPSRYPNLLVNGATGIAVGLATNIPPHNLAEAIDAVITVMDKPTATLEEVMHVMPGPDFPTGGTLLGLEELQKAYETGRGRVAIRAKTHIEQGKNGKSLIVVTELPFQVNKANALEKILRLSEEKKLLFSGIADIRDESDREGMRAVIEVRKDSDAEKILNYLYKYSDLQVTFGVNMVVIADGKPQQMGLKDIIAHYIEYQKEVVTRRTRFDLEAAKKREHILAGLMIALDNIDEVIRIIRASKTPKEAKEALIKRFTLSDIQAQAILDMRLQRLTGLEMKELREEYARILKLIEELLAILDSPRKLIAVIRKELLAIRESHALPRRTVLGEAPREIEVDENDLRVIEDVRIGVYGDTIKRLPQRLLAKAAEEEQNGALFELDTQTDQRILLFTNLGNLFSIGVEDIPETKPKDRGALLAGLLAGWEDGEAIVAMMESRDDGGELLFFTRGGMVKRTRMSEYITRTRRIAAASLKNGDKLLSVAPLREGEGVLLITRLGMSIHFAVDAVPQTGRVSGGVKGIVLEARDSVMFASQIAPEGEILVVTDRGYGKRSLVFDYDMQNRNGKGLKTLDFRKNGANGNEIALAVHVREPFTLAVKQQHGEETLIDTESVLIEPRFSKGRPLVMVMLDNIVIGGHKK